MDISSTRDGRGSPKVWVMTSVEVEVMTPDEARLYGLELIRAADKAEEEAEAGQDKPLPLSAVCVCGHTKNWHTYGRGSSCQIGPDTSPTTVYCSCPEFKEKPLPLSTVCVCGHTKNWHPPARGGACQVNVHVDEDHSTEPCECEGFEEEK